MNEVLSRFSSGELIALVAIVGGLICGSIVIMAEYWQQIRKAEIAARLKQDMLDRGMSAEEIRIVTEAGTKRSIKANSSTTC
jgi:hypothetical protein